MIKSSSVKFILEFEIDFFAFPIFSLLQICVKANDSIIEDCMGGPIKRNGCDAITL